MNNFIQNFYDAIGWFGFGQQFRYKYENGDIILESDVTFSSDWLCYIGASSKRNTKNNYAGKYGEGFKIASLVAYRDFNFEVSMESRDWKLVVTDANENIAGSAVKVLAYDISEIEDSELTRLVLSNATEEQYAILKAQVDDFYYVTNPRFGKLIAKGDTYAIFEPNWKSDERKSPGALYVNYQMRDDLDLPLVVCNHHYDIERDDRDRSQMTLYDSNEAIRRVFWQVEPEEAMCLLEICMPRWENPFGNDYRGRNWSSMIKKLLNVVYFSYQTKVAFYRKYEDKIVSVGYKLEADGQKRKMALLWYKKSEYHDKYKLVLPLFERLGIRTLDDLCRENNGYAIGEAPNVVQKKYILILERIAKRFFESLTCYDKLPECRIIQNKEAPLLGKAHLWRKESKQTNSYGHVVKAQVFKVFLQQHVLASDKFSEALAVYLHELLHQFGGDSSLQFKNALIQMDNIIIKNISKIISYEREWRAVENVIDKA